VADIKISSGELTASISPLGAELQSLTDREGRELMTDANPAFWSGRAPLLFPIIGRLHNDALRIAGREYPMQKHGFARKSLFAVIDISAYEAVFRLTDNPETRAQYPFAFELDAHFHIEGGTLHKTVTVRNTGDSDLPFSFGYHPAFAWPLPYGAPRDAHVIRFETEEPGPLRRVTPFGTIDAAERPSPVVGNILELTDTLFDDDALVWQTIKSRSLSYGVDGSVSLAISFPDTPSLGIWTKPNAAFICVEPWAGMADPGGFEGDFTQKPGIMSLPPGEERRFRMDVRLQK
jgi:galactose mutarotase-like enzyme